MLASTPESLRSCRSNASPGGGLKDGLAATSRHTWPRPTLGGDEDRSWGAAGTGAGQAWRGRHMIGTLNEHSVTLGLAGGAACRRGQGCNSGLVVSPHVQRGARGHSHRQDGHEDVTVLRTETFSW